MLLTQYDSNRSQYIRWHSRCKNGASGEPQVFISIPRGQADNLPPGNLMPELLNVRFNGNRIAQVQQILINHQIIEPVIVIRAVGGYT